MAAGFNQMVAVMVMLVLCCHCSTFFLVAQAQAFNYKDALSKSILFLEAQRSGKLPNTQRVTWRGDSGLRDGKDQNVDLVGGYYDAGDNVKYGLPMAFTVTTLSWGAIQYGRQLTMTNERAFVRSAIKWGTDYLLKATARDNGTYYQVGDPTLDHICWERPEDMDTARTVYAIDSNNPGTEVVAETAAALASASIVFRRVNPTYSQTLLSRARKLYDFAVKNQKTLQGCAVYCSVSGYQDELLWAAAWLHRATSDPKYLNYLTNNLNYPSVSEFSWDLKYAGVDVLLADQFYKGRSEFRNYVEGANFFVCSLIPGSPTRTSTFTRGGLIFMRDGANSQYATAAALLFSVYSDTLTRYNAKVMCGFKSFGAKEVMNFAKQQVDYLLGNNPKRMSYMVGFGSKYPVQSHHRAASIPSKGTHTAMVRCGEGFVYWYGRAAPNPNLITGALVGGPDKNDGFEDNRKVSPYTEPCTYINSCIVGPLAKLAAAA